VLLLSTASLQASTIFSIGGSIQSSQYSLSGVEVAMSFIASANETVTGASLVGSGGTITLKIENNLSGAPSDTALTGGTATAALSNPAIYSATTSLNTALVQGQEYWIVLTGTVNINESATPVGTVNNVIGDWSSNNGSTWTTEGAGSGYYYPNLNLTGTIAGTPEPGTIGLAATSLLALAGLVAVRRRRL
jgi:MYXO-CTERM domain-containing protein